MLLPSTYPDACIQCLQHVKATVAAPEVEAVSHLRCCCTCRAWATAIPMTEPYAKQLFLTDGSLTQVCPSASNMAAVLHTALHYVVGWCVPSTPSLDSQRLSWTDVGVPLSLGRGRGLKRNQMQLIAVMRHCRPLPAVSKHRSFGKPSSGLNHHCGAAQLCV